MVNVLAFGTYNVRKHPRVGILIDGLRRNGCTVEEINEPLLLSTAQRVDILTRPWKLVGFVWNILGLWRKLRARSRKWIRAHGNPDVVLVGYMGHFDVLLARHLFRHSPIVLDHLIFAADTAKDRGAAGMKVRLLRRLDRMAINAATLVVTDTREHQDMLRPQDESMVIPVGAPQEWYAAGDLHASAGTSATAKDEGIVFYGLYTPLQGTTVIARALCILAQRGMTVKVTMIGQGQDYEKVRRITEKLENVTFIPWIEPEQLPSVVARHGIALGIFSTTPKGLHVVPNKVYQSMAAGCAVVTSDTAPQRRELHDGVIYVRPGSPQSLADALEKLLKDPTLLDKARRESRRVAGDFTAQRVSLPLADWVRNQTRAHDHDRSQTTTHTRHNL